MRRPGHGQLRLIDLGPAEPRRGDADPLLATLAPPGDTYSPYRDRDRFGRQLRAVLALMSDGNERTLPEIGKVVAGAETRSAPDCEI